MAASASSSLAFGLGLLLLLVLAPAPALAAAGPQSAILHREHVGAVRSVRFIPKQNAVLVASDRAVLASLSLKSGKTRWRQVLPEGETLGEMMTTYSSTSDLVSFSADRGLARLWRSKDGTLVAVASGVADGQASSSAASAASDRMISASLTPLSRFANSSALESPSAGFPAQGATSALRAAPAWVSPDFPAAVVIHGASQLDLVHTKADKRAKTRAGHVAQSVQVPPAAAAGSALRGLIAGQSASTAFFFAFADGAASLTSGEVSLAAASAGSVFPSELTVGAARTIAAPAGVALTAAVVVAIPSQSAPAVAVLDASNGIVHEFPLAASGASTQTPLPKGFRAVSLEPLALATASAGGSSRFVAACSAARLCVVVDLAANTALGAAPRALGLLSAVQSVEADASAATAGREGGERALVADVSVGDGESGAVTLSVSVSEGSGNSTKPIVFAFPAGRGVPQQVWAAYVSEGASGAAARRFSLRVVVRTSEHDLVALREPSSSSSASSSSSSSASSSASSMSWARSEALGAISTLEVLDLPVSVDSFSSSGDEDLVFPGFAERLSADLAHLVLSARQTLLASSNTDVSGFVSTLADVVSGNLNPAALFSSASSSSSAAAAAATALRRSDKLIVAATEPGVVFAIEADTGRVAWRASLAAAGCPGTPTETLVLRKHAVANGDPPEIAFVTRDAAAAGGGSSSLCVLDFSSGRALRAETLSADPLVVAALPIFHHHRKLTLVIHQDLRVQLFPALDAETAAALVADAAARLTFSRVSPRTGVVQGLGVRASSAAGGDNNNGGVASFEAFVRWELPLAAVAAGERLVEVATPAAGDIAQAVGEDLGPLIGKWHKYVNPHVVVLATEAANSVTVTVVEGVTGRVLDVTELADAQGPVRCAVFENQVLCHVRDTKSHVSTMVSLALFLDAESGATVAAEAAPAFSSWELPTPVVERATFRLPLAVRAIGVTQTAHGVTEKKVLLGLESGGLLGVRRALFDPRRPREAPPKGQTSPLPPFSPFLEYRPTSVLTKEFLTQRVVGIKSAGTREESTALVVVWGLDLAWTRTMPSDAFDMLAHDFSYPLLILTVALVLVAIAVTQRLHGRKVLSMAWT